MINDKSFPVNQLTSIHFLTFEEYSSRVLTLTKEILEENASHYTVWKYRLDCVRAINASLEEEVTFLNLMAEENPKSYQVWYVLLTRYTVLQMV